MSIGVIGVLPKVNIYNAETSLPKHRQTKARESL